MTLVSFGYNCNIAQALKRYNLRERSYPFDWCESRNLTKLVDCVMNNFEGFFEEMEVLNGPKPIKGSQRKNKRYELLIPHQDPIGVQEHHDAYVRRIERLYRTLEQSAILCRYAPDFEREAVLIKEQNERIQSRFPNSRIVHIGPLDGKTEPTKEVWDKFFNDWNYKP